MATIKLRFYVQELDNVMTKYDQVKVWRSATETGSYSEITGVGTRVDLVADQTVYEYIDTTAPDTSYWYKTSYFHSGTLLESSLSKAIQALDGGLIVSLQDIRDEGIDDTELSDERAIFLSRGWQAWFEHQVGQWFTRKEKTFLIDGNGSRVMWLNVPIISIDELYINDDFVNVVDSSYYTVYNRYSPDDDRKNPRIKLKRASSNLYASYTNYIFEVGDQNQKLVGTFGYVEEDGSAPYGVHRAIMQLIIVTAETYGDGDIDAMRAGRVIEEVTDRHRIEFANLYDDLGQWVTTGLTDVDNALRMYRKPAYVGSPRRFSV